MFNEFWKMYPRKVAKKVAEKIWNKMTKQEQEECIEALPNHLAYWKLKQTETEFICHPATFLSQGRWEDELDMTQKEVKKPSLPWYSNDELTLAKGRELGLNAYAGESMGQFRQRIQQYIGKVSA